MSRSLGVELELDDWDKIGSRQSCLVNLQPSGKYLMEDFCYAGGLPAVQREISHRLHKDAITANGKTVGQNIENAECWNRMSFALKPSRSRSKPASPCCAAIWRPMAP